MSSFAQNLSNTERSVQKRSLLSSSSRTVYLLGWQIDDEESGRNDVYYVLSVPQIKKAAFEEKLGSDSFRLGDYGDVVTWGYGVPEADFLNQVLNQS